MLQDIRFAWRTVRRNASLSIAAALTLALGIAGATSMFAVLDAVLLRQLPYEDADSLVRVWQTTPEGERFSVSDADFVDLRDSLRSTMAAAAFREVGTSRVLTAGTDPRRIMAVDVTPELPEVLGVRPLIGGLEERPDEAAPTIVLGYELWRQAFQSDPSIVGRQVTVDGRPRTVTGVMPEGFSFPEGAEAWMPFAANAGADRDGKELAVIGRLTAGTAIGAARAALPAAAANLEVADPRANAGWGLDVATFDDWLIPTRFRSAVWVLFGAVALLLGIACANVANLLLAHGASRETELRVRAAIGASRWRLLRQTLVESAVLAAIGTATGLLLSVWIVDAARGLGAGRVPRIETASVDVTVLAFAALAGLLTCLLAGLLPALMQSAAGVTLTTSEAGGRTTGRNRIRKVLVAGEVALALFLLIGASLLGTSFARLMAVDPGFDVSGAVAMDLDLPAASEDDAGRVVADVIDRVAALPGVTAAGATSTHPFRQFGYVNNVTPVDRAAEAPPSGLLQAGWRSVTPGYFDALGVPVLAGRAFTDGDTDDAPRVVVVSRSLAERLWPGRDAVGQEIYWGGTSGTPRRVVGVSGDIQDVRIEDDPMPMLFVPHAQVPLPGMTIVARTLLPEAQLAPQMQAVMRQALPSLPVPAVEALADAKASAVASPRMNLLLLGAFAALALVLAVGGVYASLAFSVAERRREIAVRLALGAAPSGITRLIVRQGLTVAAVGLAAGLVAALAASGLLRSLLYGLAPTEPAVYLLAGAALLIAVAGASYLPARRAASHDPLILLRD
ncbi:MAG: ABC transporter permease [Vicinamibacterales bacterium]